MKKDMNYKNKENKRGDINIILKAGILGDEW
jgi:hypothetical protein